MTKTPLLLIFLVSTGLAGAEDRYAWLKERPVKKPRVYSSTLAKIPRVTSPKGRFVVSNVDSRRRSITVSNQKAKQKKPGPELKKVVPVVSKKEISRKENSTIVNKAPLTGIE